MSSPLTSDAGLSSAIITHMDDVCDRFELAWQAGLRPRIEDYLDETPDPERSLLLQGLLVLDLAYRRRQGEQPAAEEYVTRFPESVDLVTAVLSEEGSSVPPVFSLTAEFSRSRSQGSFSDSDGTIGQRSGKESRESVRPEVAGYEILEELGRGGMGVVYQARHQQLNRLVALKVIRAGIDATPRDRERFQVEAEAVARLRHVNILQIYEIGEAAGLPFVALELLAGGSLADRLRSTPQPALQAAELLVTLARAIDAAHRAGIVHRDLKPSNVLFDREGTPKIVDFGLAKLLEQEDGQTESGQIVGCPSYMAPEQARGKIKEIGPAADVYALGAILYEMLTGRPPFKAPTPMETAIQVIHDEPVPPCRLLPRVPRDLETICLKCLRKEPQKRYASAEELADDLCRYLDNRPIRARRVPLWERGAKWVRRHPATATLIGLAAAAGVMLGAGLLHQDAQRRNQERIEAERVAGRGAECDQELFKALAAVAEKKWTDAKLILAPLLQSLKGEPRLGSHRKRADTLLAQVEQGIQAEEHQRQDQRRYDLFLQRRNEAFFHETQFTGLDLPANLQATRAAVQEALRLFAVPGAGDSWTQSELPASLAPSERDAIVAGCYELLLVLAEAVAQTLPGEDAGVQADRGLRILDQAARLRPEPTRAYHWARAACLAHKGDGASAARQRAEADRLRSTTALDHFLDGQEHYRRRDWAAALRDFDTVLRLQPDHFWAQCLAAICALQKKSPAEAKAGLNVCIRREPGFVWLYLLRAYASGQVAALALDTAKLFPAQAGDLKAGAEYQFAAAEDDSRAAIEMLDRKPNDDLRYILLVNRGVMRYQGHRLEEAVEDLQEAIGRNDRQYEAIVTLAQVYQEQKKSDLAVEQFTRAIRLKPDYSPLFRERAGVQLVRDDPAPEHLAAALRDLDEAVKHEPPGSPILASDQTRRGELLRRMRRYEEALSACDAALRVKPGHADAHRLRILVLLDLKRFDEVIQSCENPLAEGKPWAGLHEVRGQARAGRQDFAGAIADYTLALEERPGQTRVLISRGLTYLVTDAPRLALSDFEEVLRLDPSSSDAQIGRGSARVRLGDHRAAVADAEDALRLGTPSARLFYNAARIYAQAALAVTSEVRGKGRDAVILVNKYQDRAVALVSEALQMLPSGQRAEFWRNQIQTDPALRSLSARLRFAGMAPPIPKE